MAEGGVNGVGGSSPLEKPSKFSVYQNPTLEAALTANSLRPTKSTFLCILSFSTASAFALLSIISREEGFINHMGLKYVSTTTAYVLTKVTEFIFGLIFMGAISALIKAFSLWRTGNTTSSSSTGEKKHLTSRQLGLLGVKSKPVERVDFDSAKKPPKSKTYNPPSPSDVLFPVHHSVSGSKSRIGSQNPKTNTEPSMGSYYKPSNSPGSPSSLYLVQSASPPKPSVQTSPGIDRVFSTPWSKQRSSNAKAIMSEEMLEQFLADMDERITESAVKMATPPVTYNSLNISSPGTGTVVKSPNTSGAKRSTPLRPVRMSPGSKKFTTPPKKGEGDLPPPMSMEESIQAFDHLGIYPEIEQWRDRLRQWFSSILLNPLLDKIETSHIQVMQSAARLGISITVNQVGSDCVGTPTVSSVDGAKEWQPSFTLDEEGLLHQLRANLVQALETSKLPSSNLQQSQQQNALVPVIQECIDAITEHQRLHQLMKGEWVKGLLPQSSVRADYTVQRIRELAEGTCLKNYEYLGSGEVYDKVNKKWTLELPTDSHLLLYLFCAYLEHPKWMLHVDPTSNTGAQSSKNPLFLGILPPKERFPEKYVAVVSSVPAVFHPGASILFVGKQSPPLFALYWDKKLQFSLQGRTALWDAILLLCHRIKVEYGGIVQAMHLGSSAYCILPVIDSETDE